MSPTLADVVTEVEALRARLADVEARLPPPGWEPNGYTYSADPGVSLVRNCVSGRWTVWRTPARHEAEGTTPAEAVRAWGETMSPYASRPRNPESP